MSSVIDGKAKNEVIKLLKRWETVEEWATLLNNVRRISDEEREALESQAGEAWQRLSQAANAKGGVWQEFYDFCICNDAGWQDELEQAVKLYLEHMATAKRNMPF
jgi:hypothetical protein